MSHRDIEHTPSAGEEPEDHYVCTCILQIPHSSTSPTFGASMAGPAKRKLYR